MPKFTFSSNFFHSKTTWTAISAIVSAAGALATHQLDVVHFGFAVFAALQTAFMRDTFQKAVELPVLSPEGGEEESSTTTSTSTSPSPSPSTSTSTGTSA